MDYLEKFEIPFSSLAAGSHHYHYEIGNRFFERFENSLMEKARVQVHVTLNNLERMLIFDFEMKGIMEVECDRCLNPFEYPIDAKQKLVIKLSAEEIADPANEVITIPLSSNSVNIAQHLYEYLILEIPYRKIHPDDSDGHNACDEQFLENINRLSPAKAKHETPDPRWETLKKLKTK